MHLAPRTDTPQLEGRETGREGRRSRGWGEGGNKSMKNPVNLFLELKIVSTFKDEISPPSERHDLNAKASEDKQKAPFRSSQGYPSLSRLSLHIIMIPSTLPGGLRYYFYMLQDFFFLFLFSSKQQFTTQGLTVIFIKLQLMQVFERCVIT